MTYFVTDSSLHEHNIIKVVDHNGYFIGMATSMSDAKAFCAELNRLEAEHSILCRLYDWIVGLGKRFK